MNTAANHNTETYSAPAKLTVTPHPPRLLARLIPLALISVTLTFAVGLLVLEWQAEPLIDVVCWLIVFITIWMLWSWQQVSGTLFDPYSLFILSAVAFNGGQAILEVLQLNPDGVLDGRFSPETTTTALLCVALGLIAMQCGALLAVRRRIRPQDGSNPRALDSAKLGTLRTVGWILLGISIVPTAYSLFQAVSVVSRLGYFGLYQQEAGVGWGANVQILAGFFVPAVLLILVGSGSSRGYTILSAMLITIYCLVALILGGRYSAAAPAIAYAWLWHRCKRPLPKRVLLVGAALVLFVIFPLVGNTRNTALAERSSLENLLNIEESFNPATAGLAEMGGTLQTVAYTIDLVPLVRPYDYGLQYGYSLLTVFPNFIWGVHPTIARGTPATWLIRLVDPATFAAGGGWGFSFIAEAYFNFGFWGAPLMLLLIGFLYGRFVVWGTWTSDPAKIVTVGIYLASFLVYARSDSTNIIRPLIWYALLPYLLIHVLHPRRMRVSSKSAIPK